MTHNIWSKEKPVLEEECLLIVASNFNGEYEYKLFEIKKIPFEGKWYWGILDQNGGEWGDYYDLKAELYFTMKQYQP